MSGPASLTVGERRRRQSFPRFLRSSGGEISAPDLALRAVTLAIGKRASRNVDQVFAEISFWCASETSRLQERSLMHN